MTREYVLKAEQSVDSDGLLVVHEFLGRLDGQDWIALLGDVVSDHDTRVSLLLGVSPTDDTISVLSGFLRNISEYARGLAKRALDRIIGLANKKLPAEEELERALIIGAMLEYAPNEPLLIELMEKKEVSRDLRTQAGYLLGSYGASLNAMDYWQNLDFRNHDCLLGPAIAAIGRSSPGNALRLLQSVSDQNSLDLLEDVVKDVATRLTQTPGGALELRTIVSALPPLGQQAIAQIGIAIDGHIVGTRQDENNENRGIRTSQVDQIRINKHHLGLFEGGLRGFSQKHGMELEKVVVLANRIDPPGNALHDAVKANILAGVHYEFFVPNDAKCKLYITDFRTRAIDATNRPEAGKDFIHLHHVPDSTWSYPPYIFYVLRATDGTVHTMGFRGSERMVGIAREYTPVAPEEAEAIYGMATRVARRRKPGKAAKVAAPPEPQTFVPATQFAEGILSQPELLN